MMEDRQAVGSIVETLIVAWHALSDLGAGLGEEQWKRSSDLPGWTVQDLLSHLIGIERLLEGLPAATPLAADTPAHVHNPIGELNEREVAARRALPGAAVLAEWDELCVIRRLCISRVQIFQKKRSRKSGIFTKSRRRQADVHRRLCPKLSKDVWKNISRRCAYSSSLLSKSRV